VVVAVVLVDKRLLEMTEVLVVVVAAVAALETKQAVLATPHQHLHHREVMVALEKTNTGIPEVAVVVRLR
jgi:hypothetical protein